MEEESFLYLREAKRVLKPGGRIVASYLDIAEPMHWEIFETNVRSARQRQEKPMDIFLSAAFFETWAAKLELEIIDGPGARLGPAHLRHAENVRHEFEIG